MNSKILNYSKQQKKTAKRILGKTNLLKILTKYGKVSLQGSYSFDLMIDPDIDITVISSSPREASVGVLRELIDKRLFQKYQYGDFVKFKRESRPSAYIMVLIHLEEEVLWEIEVWFQDKVDKKDLGFTRGMKNINRLEKKRILKLKNEISHRGISKKDISSYKVYDYVLNNRKNQTLEEVEKNII